MKKAVVIIIIVALLYFAWQAYNGQPFSIPFINKLNATPKPSTPTTTASRYDVTGLDTAKILQSGTKGQEVTILQRILNDKDGAGLVEDGIFGQLTFAALSKATKGSFNSISLSKALTYFNI